MVPLALGTDTGGSVRVPAAYCGIIGLKPTFGRVSTHGVFPLSWSHDHVGQLGRTAEDVRTLLDVVGTSGGNALDGNVPLRDLRGLRVGIVKEHMGTDIRPGVRRAFDRAVAIFCDGGAEVSDVSLPTWEQSEVVEVLISAPEATAIHLRWLQDRPSDYAVDTLTESVGDGDPSRYLPEGTTVPPCHGRRDQSHFWGVDILVSPTVGFVAPETDPATGTQLGALEALRTRVHCVVGIPAVTVPAGTAEDNLPAGLQMAAAWGSDHRLLSIAGVYLESLGYTSALAAPS